MVAAPRTGARRKIYFGWWVLAVSVFGAFLAAVQAQIFAGAMLPYIEEDTGWNRTSITLAVTAGSIIAGLAAPFFGRMADRHGPRTLATVGLWLTVAGLGLIALSSVTHIALFYIGFTLGRTMSSNTMSGVVPRTTVVNWFRRMRGRAMGATAMAIPLGNSVLIPVAAGLIGLGLGWEMVYVIFGAFMLVVLTPLFLLVLRRGPEDMGLLPDGDDAVADATALAAEDKVEALEYQWTLREAMRTRTLWLMISAMSIGIFANGAVGFHQFAYFKDQQIAAGAAALAVSVYAIFGAVSSGLWGLLVERVSERVLGAATVTLAGLLCLFLLRVDTTAEALIFAVLFGLMARGEGSIIVMMEARYFGRNSFGQISGFSQPFQQIALGLGPTFAAVVYDSFDQTYTVAFVVFAVMYIASAGLLWLAKAPAPPVKLPAAA